MIGDEMPWMSSREDAMSDHVEIVGPFERTYVLLNGLRVPHLTAAERGQDVTLIVDDRLAFDVPKGVLDVVVPLVACVIAVERGYGRWPTTPEEHDQPKAPAFGPIWHGVEGVETGDAT